MVTTGVRGESVSGALSTDVSELGGRPVSNSIARASLFVGVGENVAFSPEIRTGHSGCEATVWISDSATKCQVALSMSSSRAVVLTAGLQISSLSGAATYDAAELSGLASGNTAAWFTGSITVFGSQFGGFDISGGMRLGQSACGQTGWISDSGVVCRNAIGADGSRSLMITAGVRSGTTSEALSFDGVGFGLAMRNAGRGAGAALSLEMTGSKIGGAWSSMSASVGTTACEATTWESSSMLLCRVSAVGAASGGSASVMVTVGTVAVGSMTGGMSFDKLGVSAVRRENGAEGAGSLVTVSGSGLGRHGSSVWGGLGGSACEASEWGSESSVACMMASGTGRSLGVTVTSGAQAGSLSGGLSYDSGGSASGSGNVKIGSGGEVVRVVQALAHAFVGSGSGRLGSTACEASTWLSATQVRCRVGVGDGARGSQHFVVTIGHFAANSVSDAMSLDTSIIDFSSIAVAMLTRNSALVAGARIALPGTSACSPCTCLLGLFAQTHFFCAGIGFGRECISSKVRLGGSSSEATVWLSSSQLISRAASGLSSPFLKTVVSACVASTSVSQILSFDM